MPEIKKLTLKLPDEYEFEVERVSENYNGASKSYSLTFSGQMTNITPSDFKRHINPENLSTITEYADGKERNEYTGYTEIMSIDFNSDKMSQTFNVFLRKPETK